MRWKALLAAVLIGLPILALGTSAGANGGGAPANDLFADATPVASLPDVLIGSTVGAGFEKGESGIYCSGNGQSVWFSYTPTETGQLILDPTGSGFSTSVSLWKGPAGGAVADLTLVGCTVDRIGSFRVLAGTTYFISVDGYQWGKSPGPGDYELVLQSLANDSIADALGFTGLPATVRTSTFGATLEDGEPQPCGAIGATVWYYGTSPVSGPATANTFDASHDLRTNFDTVLAVYEGPPGAGFGDLTLLGCSDDVRRGFSRVDFHARAGTTYWFQVGAFDGGAGELSADDGIPEPDRIGVPRAMLGGGGLLDLTVSALCHNRPATIVGTDGPDGITGTNGRDVIAGLGGEDWIDGAGGSDIVCGGPGDDRLIGWLGADWLIGGPGDDELWGQWGDDRLLGGPGTDAAYGGPAGKSGDVCIAESTFFSCPR